MVSFELNLVILTVLIILSGFFSSAELAIFSISKLKLKKLISTNKPNAQVLKELKENPQNLLNTILIGNNLVNVASASLATAIALEFFPSGYGIAIATGVVTLVILVFGEITPKSLALKHNKAIALAVAPFIKVLSIIFIPLLFVLNKITKVFLSLFGAGSGEETLTEDEVKTVVSLGAEEGAIEKDEKEMIHRIFRLNDITVEDIMTYRSEMVGIESGTKIKNIDSKILQEHSRIPVFKEDLDELIGVFHVRDFFGPKLKKKSDIVVDKIMRQPIYVSGSKKIDKLLKEFQKKKTHLAIVVDEYGGTIGLVTIEDILEEIVGEILDETDVEPRIKKINSNEFVAEGSVPLDVLSRALRISFKSKEFDTVAGLVIGALDRVPQEKDETIIGGVKFIVIKMDGPKIKLVRVIK